MRIMIGVISDTHDDLEAIRSALEVFSREEVESIIHLGDLISPFSLRELAKWQGRVDLLWGNNEGEALVAKLGVELGLKVHTSPTELTISNREILAFHGFGSASLTEKVARMIADSGEYDLVLFGHTHSPIVERRKSLLVNPGEACGKLTKRRTIALVDLDRMEAEIVEL
ncbi:MAG: hypothetical protein DRO05_02580 [Thermoproteota archaeon]|nr:MAG: hypothetical protein DRO05_02580 [Candidatus Korarchaeota archaeon]